MNTPVSVKQEEDEGIASASLRLPRLETREATVVPSTFKLYLLFTWGLIVSSLSFRLSTTL